MKIITNAFILLVNLTQIFCLTNHYKVLNDRKYSSLFSSTGSSYLDELQVFTTQSQSEKRCLVGLTTDSWNVGQKKYKELLSVHHMSKRIQKFNIACVEIPLWDITAGPHYADLQRLLESYWIPDYRQPYNLLLKYDLIIIPDPVLAKYLVEAYFEKEAKVKASKSYFEKLRNKPHGVIDYYPPNEKYEIERILNLHETTRWMSKFPPIAVCGEETFYRLKNHAVVNYFSKNVDDFALYLPEKYTPTKRVLVLRFKNRFESLVQSLAMKDLNVTSAYPVSWMRKDWSPQEDRLASEIDVVYAHEEHALVEWHKRMKDVQKKVVIACQDLKVARVAKALGYEDVFFSKQPNAQGLTSTVLQAVEHWKQLNLGEMK